MFEQKTDRRHFREVAVLGVRFWKTHYPNVEVPASLVIACWLHDIERFIPETKCKYLTEVLFVFFFCLFVCLQSRVIISAGSIRLIETDQSREKIKYFLF